MRENVSYTGINLENVKLANRSAILKLLNDNGAMSRKDMAEQLGLTPATVTIICTDMIAAGILVEKGELAGEKRAGRRKVLIAINYQYKNVLSISIEEAETWVTISDLNGDKVNAKMLKTDGTIAPEEFLKNVASKAKELLWESHVDRAHILGIGVSIPGPVRSKSGISLQAYRIWSEPVPIKAILEKEMELPVHVENNVRAFADGELLYGNGRAFENLLFIKWGPGVGSSVVIKNTIFKKAERDTAEIGHFIIRKNGKQCRCGRRGCLETICSTHAMVDRVREQFSKDKMPGFYDYLGGDIEKINVDIPLTWMDYEGKDLWDVLDPVIDELARVVVNTITFIVPDKVIYYGHLFNVPAIEKRFLEMCKAYDEKYDEKYLIKAERDDSITYIGPLAIAANRMFFNM